MSPLTRRDIIAHGEAVPWPSLRQVEQDLLLCRSMAALFSDAFLKGQVAMRGGTLLHKVHLRPAARYSEDIDLVVVGDSPEEHIRRALRRVLSDVLGAPTASGWDTPGLAIRNAVKPSRVLRMTFTVPSAGEPGNSLTIVVEANVTERTPHRSIVNIPFEFPFRGSPVVALVNGYDIHEMLGTKMRALFQRRRGRDLFDLYWALTVAEPRVNPAEVVESFAHYLRLEGGAVGRGEFMGILESHLADRGFCSDMNRLLRAGIAYDPRAAGDFVKADLLSLLPL